MLARMPRNLHDEFKKRFQRQDITVLELYPYLLPYLIEMDRAHVISKSFYGHYQLSGIFASFPSDMNGEIKRFGLRIGKFQMGNDQLYQRNRNFVMQYLMELYGFPIASERRTSAALFQDVCIRQEKISLSAFSVNQTELSQRFGTTTNIYGIRLSIKSPL